MKGRVLQLSGLHALVEVEGLVWQCELRGRLKAAMRSATAPLAAGDWVDIEATGPDVGVVERVYPRRTKISRVASGSRGREQVIAANVDQLVIVVAARHPEPSPGFIDRAIAMALCSEILPVLCVNKVDLVARELSLKFADIYGKLGYVVLQTSAQTGEGVEELAGQLKDRVSALVGQSGVGKSSLLNHLAPGLNIFTQELMKRHERGRHTTTAARLYRLPKGGYLVDTPGIKELQLWEVARPELAQYFVEMAPLADQCHFRDCQHRSEPGCAIRAAVEQGQVSQLRYEGYLRIAASLEERP